MTEKKTYWKDLTKAERKHVKEMDLTTLRQFEKNARMQAEMRQSWPSEPCWDCRAIARKLGLPV